jgi:hypothetical protein
MRREAGPLATFTTPAEAQPELEAVLADEPGWTDELWIEPFTLEVHRPTDCNAELILSNMTTLPVRARNRPLDGTRCSRTPRPGRGGGPGGARAASRPARQPG